MSTPSVGARLLVGIDDTDAGESIGTGALARELSLHLVREHGAVSLGVTRHQLLVHPDIPYTSHNSAACIGLTAPAGGAGPGALRAVADASERFVRFLFHDGADPGLCVVPADAPLAEAAATLGRRAQREVLDQAEALRIAEAAGIDLRDLGGSGLGVIGALAACALRHGGDDGRFVSLRGIRSVPDRLSVASLLDVTAIDRVQDAHGEAVDPGDPVETRGRVRPALSGGRAVLVVERSGAAWVPVDRRRRGAQD